MKIEHVRKWEPIQEIPDELFLKSLFDSDGTLIIKLNSKEKASVLSLSFNSSVAYRNTDEGDRLKTVDNATGLERWSLYLVENSNFISWYHDESYAVRKDQDHRHYLIWTDNNVIDVLSIEDPIIYWEK